MAMEAKYIPPSQGSRDLLCLARQTYNTARQQVDALLEKKRSRLAEKLHQSKARARRVGLTAGKKAAEQELAAKRIAIQKEYETAVRSANQDCLNLVLSITREVLGEEVSKNAAALCKRIEDALLAVVERRSLRITVHPADQAAVQEMMKVQYPKLTSTIETSTDIEPGNATLETLSGRMELDWKKHFESIAAKMQTRLLQED